MTVTLCHSDPGNIPPRVKTCHLPRVYFLHRLPIRNATRSLLVIAKTHQDRHLVRVITVEEIVCSEMNHIQFPEWTQRREGERKKIIRPALDVFLNS